jgi:hypothetical protein
MVFLHGFPDQSVDARKDKKTGQYEFGSRVAKKLCDLVLAAIPSTVFFAFNFSGVPGSDDGLTFEDKTVGR